jgi:hypothetical protein
VLLLLQKLGYSVHEVKAVPLDGPGSLAGLERCCEGQHARQQAQVTGCSEHPQLRTHQAVFVLAHCAADSKLAVR